MDQDVGVVQLDAHLLGIGDEVGAEVAAVELHALDHVQVGLHALGFLDGDDAVLADLVHGVGDELADLVVVVRRDGGDLRDGDAVLHRLGLLLDRVDRHGGGRLDAALDEHRVGAGGEVAQALVHDLLGQDGRGGGAVAGDVVGLAGDFLHHLRAHVLERVLELDLLGDGHAVVGHHGGAELLVEDDVPAAGAEGDLDGVGKDVDAALQGVAGLDVVVDLLGHGLALLSDEVNRAAPSRRSRSPAGGS